MTGKRINAFAQRAPKASAWSEERTKQLEQFVMYIVEKEAGYLHGVFWIGEDLEEAKRKAQEYADNDIDRHHEWCVKKFENIDVHEAKEDAYRKTIYSTRKENT